MLSQPDIRKEFGKLWKIKVTNTKDHARGLPNHPECSETILLIQEMNLKKNPIEKNQIFLVEKVFKKKKFGIFFWDVFRFFRKSENRKIFDFFFNFFFEIIFRPEKILFFRWDFFLSSSPDSGESFGSDFRTIPAV